MTGRPKERAVHDELDRRTNLMRDEGDEDATILDYVAGWFKNGGTVETLCADLNNGPYVTSEVSRWTMMRTLYREFGETNVNTRLEGARLQGAHAMAEKALGVTLKLDERESLISREDVARAKLQSDRYAWMAERWNPAAYAEQGKSQGVTINLGLEHLQAMQRASAYEQPYQLKAASQFDAGLGSTRALGAGQQAPVTVVEAPKAKKKATKKVRRGDSGDSAHAHPDTDARIRRTRSIVTAAI